MSNFETQRAWLLGSWLLKGVVLMPVIYYVPPWFFEAHIFRGAFWDLTIPREFALMIARLVKLFWVDTWFAAFQVGVLLAVGHFFIKALFGDAIRSIFRTIRKGRKKQNKSRLKSSNREAPRPPIS